MKFVLRPGLLAAVVVGVALLCALGTWQLERKAWKEALIAQVESREASAPIAYDEALARARRGENMEYQPVFLDGAFAPALSRRVFAAREGEAGAYLFTPLRRADGEAVWINRGFVPQGAAPTPAECPSASETDASCPPAGVVRVEGVLRAPQRPTAMERMVRPHDQPADNLYFFRDPARFADAPPAGPYYVESAGKESRAPWPQASVSRADFPNRHLEYALTWFGLAAALIGVFVAYSARRS